MPNSFRRRQSEATIFFTPDGLTYILDMPPSRVILSEEGLGMPPIDYISERGPYQHGESLRDYWLKPRIMQFIVRQTFCDRQSYYTGRQQLLDMLRPNRVIGQPSQGTLRRIQPNGTIRDINCTITTGPSFAPRDFKTWAEWSFQETLKMTAYDPAWFDPAMKKLNFVSPNELVFPATFPITFNGFYSFFTLAYPGTWATYPIIVISGPMAAMTITNQTTGDSITISYTLTVGQTITIDLTYGVKTVTLNDGTNLIGSVVTNANFSGVMVNSNLATFNIVPGPNLISVFGQRTGGSTEVELFYFNRYIGI